MVEGGEREVASAGKLVVEGGELVGGIAEAAELGGEGGDVEWVIGGGLEWGVGRGGGGDGGRVLVRDGGYGEWCAGLAGNC